MAFNLIQQGDDPRRDWRKINEALEEAARVQPELRRLREEVARLSRRVGVDIVTRLPFQVYFKTNSERETVEADWWRIFYVRHGYVNRIKTDGCDDADDEGTTATEIEVPDGTAVYWVWVSINLTSAANTIGHGATWTGYPSLLSAGVAYRPLARIDTDTFSDDKRAVVRQFQCGDIWLSDMLPVWLA